MIAKMSTPGPDKQTLIVREHADDFVGLPLMRTVLPRASVWGNRDSLMAAPRTTTAWRAPGQRSDEAAALDAEQRYGIDVFRLAPAHKDTFKR